MKQRMSLICMKIATWNFLVCQIILHSSLVLVYWDVSRVITLPSALTFKWLWFSNCILVQTGIDVGKRGMSGCCQCSQQSPGSTVLQTHTHTHSSKASIYTSKVCVCWWVIWLLCGTPAACNGHICRSKSTPTYWEWYYMIMFLAVCKNSRQHCSLHFLQCIITHVWSLHIPFADTHKRKDQTHGLFLCRRHSLC